MASKRTSFFLHGFATHGCIRLLHGRSSGFPVMMPFFHRNWFRIAALETLQNQTRRILWAQDALIGL
jgi:hypothetical protein